MMENLQVGFSYNGVNYVTLFNAEEYLKTALLPGSNVAKKVSIVTKQSFFGQFKKEFGMSIQEVPLLSDASVTKNGEMFLATGTITMDGSTYNVKVTEDKLIVEGTEPEAATKEPEVDTQPAVEAVVETISSKSQIPELNLDTAPIVGESVTEQPTAAETEGVNPEQESVETVQNIQESDQAEATQEFDSSTASVQTTETEEHTQAAESVQAIIDGPEEKVASTVVEERVEVVDLPTNKEPATITAESAEEKIIPSATEQEEEPIAVVEDKTEKPVHTDEVSEPVVTEDKEEVTPAAPIPIRKGIVIGGSSNNKVGFYSCNKMYERAYSAKKSEVEVASEPVPKPDPEPEEEVVYPVVESVRRRPVHVEAPTQDRSGYQQAMEELARYRQTLTQQASSSPIKATVHVEVEVPTGTVDIETQEKRKSDTAFIQQVLKESRALPTRSSSEPILDDFSQDEEESEDYTYYGLNEQEARMISEMPNSILGDIAEFTMNDVDVQRLQRERVVYCIDNRWHNCDGWYCVDVVSKATRFFYNSKTGEIAEISRRQCLDILASR